MRRFIHGKAVTEWEKMGCERAKQKRQQNGWRHVFHPMQIRRALSTSNSEVWKYAISYTLRVCEIRPHTLTVEGYIPCFRSWLSANPSERIASISLYYWSRDVESSEVVVGLFNHAWCLTRSRDSVDGADILLSTVNSESGTISKLFNPILNNKHQITNVAFEQILCLSLASLVFERQNKQTTSFTYYSRWAPYSLDNLHTLLCQIYIENWRQTK
jgi:hypothetical protein